MGRIKKPVVNPTALFQSRRKKKLKGQPDNPGSSGKPAVKWLCEYVIHYLHGTCTTHSIHTAITRVRFDARVTRV